MGAVAAPCVDVVGGEARSVLTAGRAALAGTAALAVNAAVAVPGGAQRRADGADDDVPPPAAVRLG